MPPESTDFDALKNYFQDGRIKQIPARMQKRRLLARWLAERFEPDRTYTEKAVNELLSHYHPDFATLRREMIDNGFMQRKDGLYWRSPGRQVEASNPRAPESPHPDWSKRMIGMKLDLLGDSEDLRKQYEAVNEDVGKLVDFKTNGIVMHTAGPIPGGWRVVDFWESREKFEAFGQTLMPIIQKHGLPPAQPEIWDVVNSMAGKQKT